MPTGRVVQGDRVASGPVPIVGQDGDLILRVLPQAGQDSSAENAWDRDLEEEDLGSAQLTHGLDGDLIPDYGWAGDLKTQVWVGTSGA